MSRSPLLPERHPQPSFFIADIFDNIPVKDDMASMEHPVFSLSTKTDHRVLIYENNGVTVSIKPTTDGLPTIFDKDILLYCGSLIIDQINKGLSPSKTIRFICHDLLVTTNRPTCGRGYEKLKDALERLHGVSITTDIRTNNIRQSSGFHLIESYHIIDRSPLNNRMVALEITLSDWFYNSLIGQEMLTINRDYFRLRKPLERRLYELTRKHCGKQKEWKIKLENLRNKTGSTSQLRLFRFYINKIAETNHLPDYEIDIDENDLVIFTNRNFKEYIGLDFDNLPRIRPETMDKARLITIEAETGWDFYAIHRQFCELIAKNPPDNVDGAFIGFVRKKVAKCP